jgi:hypothetical protein
MLLKKLHQLEDWHRALLILPAIIVSNFCFFIFFLSLAFTSRGQPIIQLFLFLLPIPFCIVYVSVLCQCRVELCIAGSLALFLWLYFDLVMLISFFVHFTTVTSYDALGLFIAFVGTALCALCAYLGQKIRRKILTRINNSQAI